MNGMAPADPHDYVGWTIVALGVIATVLAFAVAIKVSIWPGESELSHPKFLILRRDR